ncbi:MAG: carboxypeptidase-like regulatory domain-containing protein, partial [Blastocatellia bacterium]
RQVAIAPCTVPPAPRRNNQSIQFLRSEYAIGEGGVVCSFYSSIKQSSGLLSILLLCAQPLLARQPAPALRGQVMDQLGAMIVGVTVTATNSAGEAKSTKTDNEGVFVISGLPPGRYTVRAEAAGFAVHENTTVEIAAGRPASLNIKLSATIAGGFSFGSGAPATSNRRIELQLNLNF